VLYPGDLQVKYITTLQQLFAETPLAAPSAFEALRYLKRGGIKGVPLIMAQIGVLERHGGQPGVDRLAQDIVKELSNDVALTRAMLPATMRDLLRYFMQREDMTNAIRVGSLFPDVAAYHGVDGISMMLGMYRALYMDDKEMQVAALELLRRYIRQSDTTSARRALVQFGRELGLQVRDALEATYAIKRLMGGIPLLDYSEFLHRCADLLESGALAYADKGQIPSLGALGNSVQSLSGGLLQDESDAIAQSILGMAQGVATLYEQFHQFSPRAVDRHIDQLIQGEANPHSALDVLWIIGGYFANRKRYRMRFSATQHPFGEHSAITLRNEAEVSHQLLRGIVQAFSGDKEMRMTAEAVLGEIESLWGVVPEKVQKSIVRDLAVDFQRLAQLVIFIGENGDARALQDSGLGRRIDSGKQQPRSTLEFYRYVYSYFKSS
jgi:hypothetical protein